MSSALKIHKPLSKNTSHLADQLGTIKAQISDLQIREAEIKEALKESGECEVEGKLFRVTVSRFDKTTTDYPALLEKLEVRPSVLKKYQTTKEQVTIKVTARQSE